MKYFEDTDTAVIEFSEQSAHETREINENISIDLDKNGNLVVMRACSVRGERVTRHNGNPSTKGGGPIRLLDKEEDIMCIVSYSHTNSQTSIF